MSKILSNSAYLQLNTRERSFVDHYIIDKKKQESAIKAGFSAKSAHVAANRLLKKDKIQAALQERMQDQVERLEIKADDVIRECLAIAKSDLRKLFDDHGNLLPAKQWPDEIAASVASIEVDELWEGRGDDREQTGFTRRVRLWDKTKALEMLGRNLKLFTDKLEVGMSEDLAKALNAARARAHANKS